MLLKRLLSAWLVAVISVYSLNSFAEAAPCWVLLPEKKQLEFLFDQAGTEEQGLFEGFSALFLFDPEKPELSRFSVSVDLSTLNTGDADRDEILRSEDMFDVKRWPKASFDVFESQKTASGGYEAQAKLTIRDQTRPVLFPFTIKVYDDEEGQKMFQLSSQLDLKRLDFGVGQGDWVETTWISDSVAVRVNVLARAAPGSECAVLRSAD